MKTSVMPLSPQEERVIREFMASEANALIVDIVTGRMNEHLVAAAECLLEIENEERQATRVEAEGKHAKRYAAFLSVLAEVLNAEKHHRTSITS